MELQANGYPKRVGPTALSGSATTIFTADRRYAIERFMLTNSGSSDSAVTIYIVPSGGTPASTNMIANAYPVPVNDIGIIVFPVFLNTGDKISAFCTNSANLTFHINGTQFGVQ